MTGRVLGLDWGTVRIGIAISDPFGWTAQPVDTLTNDDQLLAALRRLIGEREVERLVVGLPRHLDGGLGEKAAAVHAFVARLGALEVEVETWDERLTTREAQRRMREAGLSRKKRKELRDVMAAQLMLQSYLDAHRTEEDPDVS